MMTRYCANCSMKESPMKILESRYVRLPGLAEYIGENVEGVGWRFYRLT